MFFGKKKKKKSLLGKIIRAFLGIYAGLFCVFFFDLDGKLLYYVVEPFMKNHFDNMERRDPHSVPYDMLDTEYMK